MADTRKQAEEAQKILSELKDKGVTDLDGLVRQLVGARMRERSERKLICDIPKHYCFVVPSRLE